MADDVVVIGSSRGLGAALVRELLDHASGRIFGISRTPLNNIPDGNAWSATGRYFHLQQDIAAPDAPERLAEVVGKGTGRLWVIYNAAHIEKDYTGDGKLDIAAFDRVNHAGISGLRNVLTAFEGPITERGGVLAGISSFWGRLTPVSLPYVAYPATKAYLDSVFKSLRYLWPRGAYISMITIGNIKERAGTLPSWFIPTYRSAARQIVKRLFVPNPPQSIEFPLWHAVVYKYILRIIPGRLLPVIFGAYLRLEARSGIPAPGSK